MYVGMGKRAGEVRGRYAIQGKKVKNSKWHKNITCLKYRMCLLLATMSSCAPNSYLTDLSFIPFLISLERYFILKTAP